MKRGEPINEAAAQRRAVRAILALQNLSPKPYHRNSPSIPAKGQAERSRALSKAAI